jgi:AraC-like DNA-binding protein
MVNFYDNVKSHPEIFRQLACKELLFVHYDCPFERSKTVKWSQHHYFLYILSGKKAYHTPGRSWLLQKNDAVFIKKGASIVEKFFEEVLCIITFFVPDSYLHSFVRQNASLIQKYTTSEEASGLLIPVDVTESLNAYIQSVLPYFYTETPPTEELLELKFRELLLSMITNDRNKQLRSFVHTFLLPEADNLQQIMEANCYYNLTLQDYARLCNRSLSSFKRDFSAVYKTSPAVWLLQKKLDYAYQLLLENDKSINEVSFECGFENNSHFSRVFKKRFGASPLKFRKTVAAI